MQPFFFLFNNVLLEIEESGWTRRTLIEHWGTRWCHLSLCSVFFDLAHIRIRAFTGLVHLGCVGFALSTKIGEDYYVLKESGVNRPWHLLLYEWSKLNQNWETDGIKSWLPYLKPGNFLLVSKHRVWNSGLFLCFQRTFFFPAMTEIKKISIYY